MYALHDNGRALFDSAQTCTPIQRFVYILAKNEHGPDPPDDQDPTPPSGLGKAKRFRDSTGKFR